MELADNPRRWGPSHRQFALEQWWRSSAAQFFTTRVPNTGWNGRVNFVPRLRGHGIAGMDGTIHLNRETVGRPIQHMFDRAGRRHLPRTLKQYKRAVTAVLEQQAYLSSARGKTAAQSAIEADARPSNLALDVGVTKAWAHQNVNDFIKESGLDKVAPGIGRVKVDNPDPKYTPAAKRLVKGLSKQTGQKPEQVMNALVHESPDDRWKAAAEMVFENSKLRDLVPENEQAMVKGLIEQSMREPFDRLGASNTAGMKQGAVQRLSAHVGRDSLRAARKTVSQEVKAREYLAKQEVKAATKEARQEAKAAKGQIKVAAKAQKAAIRDDARAQLGEVKQTARDASRDVNQQFRAARETIRDGGERAPIQAPDTAQPPGRHATSEPGATPPPMQSPAPMPSAPPAAQVSAPGQDGRQPAQDAEHAIRLLQEGSPQMTSASRLPEGSGGRESTGAKVTEISSAKSNQRQQ